MNSSSRILVLSHCLLNKSTRWWQNGKPIERNIGLAKEIIEFALGHNIGIIQMPCPEFTFCGNPRPSRTKDEYEMLPGFNEHCDKLAGIVIEQLKTLIKMSKKPQIQILAIVGVRRSPSCAVNSAIKVMDDGVRSYGEKGIFTSALERKMLREGLSATFLEFDFDNPNEIVVELERLL